MLKTDSQILRTVFWGSILWSVLGVCSVMGQEPETAQNESSGVIRIALFNVWELGREKIDQLDANGDGAHPQLLSAAAVLAEVQPDIVILNEIDYDPERNIVRRFRNLYLNPTLRRSGRADSGLEHDVYLPVNTGVSSGMDLDNDGRTDSPGDAWGFGRYPGQYGMAVLSRFPVNQQALRTFRGLRWVTMPGHLMPDGREGRPAWYSAEEASLLRLSSKSHWDVPVEIDGLTLHLLISHPTPPVFDSAEDRNGRRNHDEIRLWADYLSTDPDDRATYLVDDQGRRGGLGDKLFIIAGDLNADPYNPGPKGPPAIDLLLKHPRISDPAPMSSGEQPKTRRTPYPGESRSRTSTYGRLDYLLPSTELEIKASGVFLPPPNSPNRRWVEGDQRASDHQLVWLDVSMKGSK